MELRLFARLPLLVELGGLKYTIEASGEGDVVAVPIRSEEGLSVPVAHGSTNGDSQANGSVLQILDSRPAQWVAEKLVLLNLAEPLPDPAADFA